jgi:transcriptional regulator with XRE-family HTH domain
MNDSLGSRLRRQRQRRQLTLADVAERTKIGIAHLRSLERDDVSQFPPGIFRRSFVRSYAEAVGLDPDDVVADFLAQFPEPEGLMPGESAARQAGGAQSTSKSQRAARQRSAAPMRLVLADEAGVLGGGPSAVPLEQRLQALGIDLGIVAACSTCAWLVTHTPWAPIALVAVTYYALSMTVLGNTFGGATAARHAERRRVGAGEPAEDRGASPARLTNPFGASLESDLPSQDSHKGSQVPA